MAVDFNNLIKIFKIASYKAVNFNKAVYTQYCGKLQ